MSVICQCASCKAKYQVGDQYAGRTIKCPKCSAAVVVPAVAQPASQTGGGSKLSSAGGTKASSSISSKVELPRARAVTPVEDPPTKPAPAASVAIKVVKAVALKPADTAADDEDSDAATPVDNGLGFLAEEPVKPKRRPAPLPADIAADDEDADHAPPVDDGLGFLADEPAVPKGRTGSKGGTGTHPHSAPAVAEQSPAEDESGGDLASIAGLADPLRRYPGSSKGVPPLRSKKKKKGFPSWMIPTIAGVSVAVVVVIVALVYLNSNSKPKGGSNVASSTSSGGKGASKAASEPKIPVLTIDWPESQRAGASLSVNGEKREVPSTGAIEIPLPPSKEQYHLHLERPGFKPQNFARVFQEDDKQSISEWERPELKGLDWEQDFDAAKQTATNEHKHVLIFFDASDAKESSFASGRLKEAVAKRKEFRERADKEYVCVYIDNPKNAEAQGEVKDADRNSKLTEQFGIKVFPTVVVTDPKGRDPKGRPFGVLEGYTISGVTAFLALMDKWEADGKHFFAVLAKFDAMLKDKGSPNVELAGEVLDFLELSKLDRFYAHTMKKAVACLPQGEGRPVTKDAAEMWMRRLQMAARNSDEAKKVVDEFDHWKKTRTFKDREMGALLHLAAAGILAQLDLRKEAAEKCQEGLALQPHNPMVRAYLERFSRILSVAAGQPVLMPVGSGTGYCIAEGNYLLTNHHVIRGAKEIKVRLNGETEMYPAKLIADNESGDMAILKIELPAAKKLVPIPLMANELKIGERVCALGWPGVMSQNITLTFTQGVVSTLPPPDDDEAFIVTDCTVNPGNSGGPLCSVRGGVAGMVTRKSQITSHESSYGMAIPVGRLRKFLAEKLPHDARMPPPAGVNTANMELSDVAEKVKPSVVYIENIQEIHAPGPGHDQEQEAEPGE